MMEPEKPCPQRNLTVLREDFERLRSLCYPDTDVFLACFSVVQPSSFQNITEKWLPEIRTHNPQAPVLLVGTQADLRDDVNVLILLDQGGREGPVPQPQAQGLAEKIRACCYLECSALTQKNLKEVFDSAILSAIEHKARLEKKLNAKGVHTRSLPLEVLLLCLSGYDCARGRQVARDFWNLGHRVQLLGFSSLLNAGDMNL
ncbi:Rho-related GTP-binding protein RhoV [Cricetulus griseus]|uniref:Rho-related GTP-binding protein RhoV n=1 Tax=Cricetulus griseus TaxID=10029 RepID=G3I475_CRIGR|nr:Rho-related GTP-binding protein RhoV [Cricetulus griseus]